MSLHQIPTWAVVLAVSGATLAFGQAAASGGPTSPAPISTTRPVHVQAQAPVADGGGVITNI
jgi:hypothetical protein